MPETHADYRALGWRSACAASAVGVAGLMGLASAGVDAFGLSLMAPMVGDPGSGDADAYLGARAIVAFASGVAMLLAVIAFSLWFYRANRNVTSFVGGGMRQRSATMPRRVAPSHTEQRSERRRVQRPLKIRWSRWQMQENPA